jgi:hypothetical protein
MGSQDYPIHHFRFIGELALALRTLPAQVLSHDYSYESFGSWQLTFKTRGIVFRLVFDGHEQWYVLEESEQRKAPYQWSRTVWEKREVTSDRFPLAEVIAVIANRG